MFLKVTRNVSIRLLFQCSIPKKGSFFWVIPYTVAKNVLKHCQKLEGSELKLQRFIPRETPEVNKGKLIEHEFSLFLWNHS